MKTIGDRILEEIIREDLVQADSRDVCVWRANAAEVLEAICLKYAHRLHVENLSNELDQP